MEKWKIGRRSRGLWLEPYAGCVQRPPLITVPAMKWVARVATAAIWMLILVPAFTMRARADGGDPRLAPPSQPLVEGRKIFETKGCVQCHTIRGTGGVDKPGPDLARAASWHDIMQFTGSLWNHRPAMIEMMRTQGIERPIISPEEMGKLAAYLFYEKFFDEPGDATRGRQVFEGRSCSHCHQIGGHGGTIGPRLDELKPFASSFFLAQALWNHGPEMAAKMAELKVTRPRLEADDVPNIVAFLRGDAGGDSVLDLTYAQAGSPQVGQTIFRDKGCIQCHAIGGVGGTVGPDLGNRRPLPHVGAVAAALWNHGPAMWEKMKQNRVPFPRLSDREIADLLAYVYFAQYMAENGNATRGETLFREKSCAACHAVAGDGPTVGPDLAKSDAIRSSLHWAAAIWNHSSATDAQIRETQTAYPQFDDDEMRDLVEYIRTHRGGK